MRKVIAGGSSFAKASQFLKRATWQINLKAQGRDQGKKPQAAHGLRPVFC